MALLGLLVWPAIVVGAVALVSRNVLQRRSAPSPGRVGVGGVAAGALLAAALGTAIAVGMDDGYYVECGGSGTRWLLALAHFGGLALGGVALGGVAAERVRTGRLLARHGVLAVSAVIVTLIVVAEVLFLGLSCYGR